MSAILLHNLTIAVLTGFVIIAPLKANSVVFMKDL